MRERSRSTRNIAVACGLALATVLFAYGQQQPEAPPAQVPGKQAQVRTAEQQFKNIKVLTSTPANQLNLAMHGISGALGVDCVHCHVWEQFDKDVKPAKQVARRMITMVRQMNETYFGGQQVITCYTCHRGSTRPVGIRIIPDTI